MEEAVRSVKEQPYQKIEILLVDDGSTDGSSELCDQLSKENEKIHVLHKENGGVSSARNVGIKYILDRYDTGYIAFLDADDYWCANAITEQVARQIEGENDTDIFAFGGFQSNQKAACFSKPYEYLEARKKGGNSALWSLKGQFVANMYSIELLRKWKINFSTKLQYSEDVIFRLQCAFLSRNIHYLPRYLYCYRENHTSAMSKVLKIKAIDYYMPIINGWVESDTFLNAYIEETGETCRAGYVLAGIYFLDMAVDHYKRGGRETELVRAMTEHPDYACFIRMKREDVSPKQYKEQQLLLNKPKLFKYKYRLFGIVEWTARWFAKTTIGSMLRNKWRYPLREMPSNL